MIVYGSGLYGRTDETHEGYVATMFGHIWYIPLVPTKSYFVTSHTGPQFNGVPIPLSMRSIFVGYARGMGWASIVIGAAVFAFTAFMNWWPQIQLYLATPNASILDAMPPIETIVSGLFVVAGATAVALCSVFNHASAQRVHELSQMVGRGLTQK